MANEDNLIRFTSEQSREEAKKNGSKGGVASGKARREKANFKKLLEVALNEPYKGDLTNAEAMVISLISEALGGNVKAFETVRDTVGQKPVEKKEDKITGNFTIGWSDDGN